MLETRQLTKRYEDGLLALDALNLKVAAGEIFTLLGANGAGKTTTINLFLNFIRPTDGQVLVNNIDVVQNPLSAKSHLAYLSENVRLYENFTARQNLDFFAKVTGKTDLTKEDYYEILRKVGLQDIFIEKKVKNFSKGMRQKVGLAIMLVKDADNLLLDEPSSGLDPKAAYELVEILKELKQKGKSILLCTHDIFRAREVSDHVGIMKQGRMLLYLDREQLMNDDLEQIYLKYMKM